MTAHDAFFQTKRPAAVLKHKVLSEYTRVFAGMVGSRNPSKPIWVIDGYAGAGAYDSADGEGLVDDGSPLVVLKMAQNIPNRDVRCVFIESRSEVVDALRNNIAPFVDAGTTAKVLVGDVQDKIGEAWSLVGGNPVVTFLDPFGVAMRRSTMTDLLLGPRTCGESSEVLLNINVQAVGRLGGLLEEVHGRVVPKDRQDRGVRRADEFLGGTWWREEFYGARHSSGESAAQAAVSVIRSYRRQVEQATGRRSISVEIRRRPTHQPLFLLTLFFAHPYAGYKFADAASRATKEWRRVYREQEFAEYHGRLDSQQSLFEAEDLEEDWERAAAQAEAQFDQEWVELIKENLRRSLSQRRDLPLADNIETVLGTTVGLAGETHLRRAWNALVDEGVAQRRDTQKKMYASVISRA